MSQAWIRMYGQRSVYNNFCGEPQVFLCQMVRFGIMLPEWHQKWCSMHITNVNSAEIPIKGASGVFHSTLQHSRPDSLTAYVTIASKVITHSLFNYKEQSNA